MFNFDIEVPFSENVKFSYLNIRPVPEGPASSNQLFSESSAVRFSIRVALLHKSCGSQG